MAILMVIRHQDTIQDASMTHSMQAAASQPIPLSAAQLAVLLPFTPLLAQFAQTLLDFRSGVLCPAATQKLESDLQGLFRELGRSALDETLNSLEPAAVEQVPDELKVGGTCYRRRFKSPRTVDSTFGRLQLWRWLYEPRTSGERCLFPLEHLLGLVGGATPALADRVGRLAAQYPQRDVLRILREENGLSWSHELLRATAAAVAAIVGCHRQAAQVKEVIGWLRQAQRGSGPYDVVLASGRDGVMVPMCGGRSQEAAIATMAVYDRKGRRLGTVYLGCMPEALQATLTQQLTALIKAVLSGWKGRRPRLAYITDGGSVPEAYYHKVLRKMEDPRRPGELLQWVRVLDYYHATLYISKLAEALFGESWRVAKWARRMRRMLKEADGLKRVLQSASYYRNEQKLKGERQKAFEGAYRYLYKRRKHMRYADLRAKGMPIGSGVTEAGCKVMASQRLKLSGMRWKKEGGQVVLTLRAVWLSGVWKEAWKAHLEEGTKMNLDTYEGCLRADHAAVA
jgi:hypothetical protein